MPSRIDVQRPQAVPSPLAPLAPDPKFHNMRYDEKPYWDVERARIPNAREVPVQIIVNGLPVATKSRESADTETFRAEIQN